MSLCLTIDPISRWMPCGDFPCIIAGPCSAESEEQVMETARQVAKLPEVKVFRAGIWKPRTRPGAFEGVGKKGLGWMQRVQRETGLRTTVEVANPKHVGEALEAGMDILWIGARTVVNPFSVQEIGEALRGVDIPVMVKNPVNPDLKTWLGALERLNGMGVKRLAAVHRGFSFFQNTPYRNAPMWEIPIELKRLCPEVPVISDPSHICGETSMLLATAQKALDLEMNGLMIEVHIRPHEALTDKRQQITPDELGRLVSRLVVRKESAEIGTQNLLERLRSEIDKIDQELIDILARRMSVVEEIGKYKKANRITILQLKRWNQVIRERVEAGELQGLSREFLLKLLEAVHEESIQRQIDVMNREEE